MDYFAEDTIVNKLGISDPDELFEVEEKIVAEKIISLLKESEKFDPNLDYFKHIHRVLFEDLYDFAGQFRKVEIAKGDSKFPFAFVQFLPAEAERIFGDLADKKYFKGMNRSDFIKSAVQLSVDLNALHPFREGNGRTIRMYLMIVAYLAGFLLDYSLVSAEEIITADRLAFEGDERRLTAVYEAITLDI